MYRCFSLKEKLRRFDDNDDGDEMLISCHVQSLVPSGWGRWEGAEWGYDMYEKLTKI